MEGTGNQDQEQEPDPIRSQLRGGFLAAPKAPPPQLLLFASEKQALQHHHPAAAAAEASSLSLFFPSTHQTNDTAAAYSSSRDHNPTIAAPPAALADYQMDTPPAATTRFRWMRELFSFGQWQELELQALIYKYMLAGASIPMELILPIKRSLLTRAALDQHHLHAAPLLQAGGYWGRCAMDPEPGRCRRTDGKKWRCSREVMPGRRYCERHALRGKSRSRKLVEAPSPPAAAVPGVGGTQGPVFHSSISTMPMLRESGLASAPSPSAIGMGSHEHEQRPQSDHRMMAAGRCLPESYPYPAFLSHDGLPNDTTSGRVLRHFFDDWPRSSQQVPHNDTTSVDNKTVSVSGQHRRRPAAASAFSIPAPPESHPSSDFCLKLYTGSSDRCGPRNGAKDKLIGEEEQQRQQVAALPPAWPGLGRQMEQASMGGPLAEALGGPNTSGSLPFGMTILQRPI